MAAQAFVQRGQALSAGNDLGHSSVLRFPGLTVEIGCDAGLQLLDVKAQVTPLVVICSLVLDLTGPEPRTFFSKVQFIPLLRKLFLELSP